MYRKSYETQLEKTGRITKSYLLVPPEEVLLLLAGFIISGIVGGLAYDSFKKLLKRCIKESSHEKLRKKLDKMSEVELKEFYNYVRTYYRMTRKRNEHIEKSLKSKIQGKSH